MNGESLGFVDSPSQVMELVEREQPDRIVLLGDILYHGPRNDLPEEYNPKGVIALLNSMSDEILTVRGNCEAEVDDMVLDFNVLAEYAILYINNRLVFLTHGHKFNPQNMPKLKKGDILFNGHTHVSKIEEIGKDSKIVAIGETGIDLLKGGALHKQIDIFMQHVNISERLAKPLIIHCVKAHDIISEIRKRISPKMDWIIH